jgi:MbtH protein
MSDDERDDQTRYKVVLNHEEQYSIWPADRENAPGWRDAGQNGTKAECLAYIERVWTDMRPLSLRRRMDKNGSAGISLSSESADPESRA